jgi:hypothetical protein
MSLNVRQHGMASQCLRRLAGAAGIESSSFAGVYTADGVAGALACAVHISWQVRARDGWHPGEMVQGGVGETTTADNTLFAEVAARVRSD